MENKSIKLEANSVTSTVVSIKQPGIDFDILRTMRVVNDTDKPFTFTEDDIRRAYAIGPVVKASELITGR